MARMLQECGEKFDQVVHEERKGKKCKVKMLVWEVSDNNDLRQ